MTGNKRFSRFIVSIHELVVTIFYIISVWCTKHALHQKHYNSVIYYLILKDVILFFYAELTFLTYNNNNNNYNENTTQR